MSSSNKGTLSSLGHPAAVENMEENDVDRQLKEVRLKITAVEYCLDYLGTTEKPKIVDEELKKLVKRWEDSDKITLLGVFDKLQGKETALLQIKVAESTAAAAGLGAPLPSSPLRVDDFTAVWTSIVNNKIVKNPENPRLWSLPDGVEWIGGVKELYNRKYYDVITDQIFSLSHVLVIGTPGIGKTLYLMILLVHLAGRARAAKRDPPSIHYQRKFGGSVQILSFLPDGLVEDVTRVPFGSNLPDYLLSDSVDLDPPYGKLFNLEVASDKEINYNNFHKRVQESRHKGYTHVMPLFEFDEIRFIWPVGGGDACAAFRFEVFGGSARNVVGVQRTGFDIHSVVDETLTLLFSDVKATHYGAWEIVARQISEKLLTTKDSDGNQTTVSSMMWHMPQGGKKTWASKYMQWLAAAIVDNQTTSVVEELEKIIGRSGMGFMFEAMGHRKLLTSTVPFRLKSLLGPPLPPDPPAFEEMEFKGQVIRFKTVDEIRNLPDGAYGVPVFTNFAVVDAIIQPKTLIQFTIAPIKHKGSVQQLPNIREHLRAPRNEHQIIFVIPLRNIDTFRFHTELGDIRQYACVVDPSVMDESSLLNANEKKRWRSSK